MTVRFAFHGNPQLPWVFSGNNCAVAGVGVHSLVVTMAPWREALHRMALSNAKLGIIWMSWACGCDIRSLANVL